MVDSLENIVTSAQAFVDEMEMDEVNFKVEQLNRKNIKKSVASVFRHSSKEDMFKSMRKSYNSKSLERESHLNRM